MIDLLDHVRRNRAFWDQKAEEFVKAGEESWARDRPAWGVWSVPEAEVGMLPNSLGGKDVIEL
jgi:hypothetical protein